MALDPTDTSPWKNALLEVIWAEDQSRGGFFFFELQRQGTLTVQDIQTIRTAYEAYKTTRNNRPSFTPAHEDTSIRETTDVGKKPTVGPR